MTSNCSFFKNLIEKFDEESQAFEDLSLVSRAERGIRGPKRKTKLSKKRPRRSNSLQLPPLPSTVDWNHVRLFYYVATARGFSRAAQYLQVSQPSLSRAVQQLEQELGKKLLVRDSTLSLTAAGCVVLDAAQESFQYIETLKDRL